MEREEQGFQGLDLVLGIVRRRWPIALICFLVLFSSTFTLIWFLPNLFLSSATVLIERQQIPDEMVRSTVTSALETRLGTISEEILSRNRLEQLIQSYGLYTDMQDAPMEKVIERMRKDISVALKGSGQRANSTTVSFTVSFKGADSQKTAVVTNVLASFYIEENLKARSEQAAETSSFFRIQLQQAEESLKKIEEQVSDFKRTHVGELPHQQEANIGNLEQLNTRLRLNSDKQVRAREQIKALEERIAQATAPAGGPDATATRIAELRMILRELRKRYSDKYPDVIRVKAEIAALVDRLAEQGSSNAPDVRIPDTPQVTQMRKELSDAQVELTALNFEADQLNRALQGYEQRLAAAPLAEQQYQILMRDYETTTELYRSLLLRQKEAELAENMEQRNKGEQFRIIDPALPSEVPAAPNRPMLWAVAGLLSLGAAAGLAFLLEQTDTSFHSAEDLRTTSGLPLLVSIPQIVTPRDRRRRKIRTLLAATSSVVVLVLVVGASYWFALGNERLSAMLMR